MKRLFSSKKHVKALKLVNTSLIEYVVVVKNDLYLVQYTSYPGDFYLTDMVQNDNFLLTISIAHI